MVLLLVIDAIVVGEEGCGVVAVCDGGAVVAVVSVCSVGGGDCADNDSVLDFQGTVTRVRAVRGLSNP